MKLRVRAHRFHEQQPSFHMVSQEFAHKTLLKLTAFTDLSFPNNELRNTPSRIVYSKKDQIFISTNGVSAKVGARHSGPGKHPSQSARILLRWGLKQSRSNKEISAAFP